MARRVVTLAGVVIAFTSCSVKPSGTYRTDFKSLLVTELSVRGLDTPGASFCVDNRPSLRHTFWHVTFPSQGEQAAQVFASFKDACERAIVSSGASINGRGSGNGHMPLAEFSFDYSLHGHQGTVYTYLVATSDEGKFAIFFVKLEN